MSQRAWRLQKCRTQCKECIEAITEAKIDNDKKEKFRENIKKFMNELPKEPNATGTCAENESSIVRWSQIIKYQVNYCV